MRSAVAPELRRAQASTSSIMTPATVSVPMICAKGSAFSNRSGMASCFFLAGRSVGDRFGQSLGKGRAWAFWAQTSSFPPTLISFVSFGLRGVALSKLPSSPRSWTGFSFWGPVCPCWSLQFPGRCLKVQGHTFHTPHHRIDV